MAFISCPECGKAISDKATTCPHCGCPTEKMSAICPKCGDTNIEIENRGYTLSWGILGSKWRMNVCRKCGHKWNP